MRGDRKIRRPRRQSCEAFTKSEGRSQNAEVRRWIDAGSLLHSDVSLLPSPVLPVSPVVKILNMSVAENIAGVKDRIASVARRSGRISEEITLMAVSKTVPPERIREAHTAGLRVFG